MRMHSALLFVALSASASGALAESAPAAAPAAALSEWALDATHSRIGFSVPHLVISEVEGDIKKWKGKVLLDEKNLQNSQVEFTAESASIDTNNPDRDKHLRSPEFFDTEKFPEIKFKSTKITKAGKGYKLQGDLTMHGVTKPVTLDAVVSEAVTNPWGKQVRSVKITGQVKRQDWGLNWSKTMDKGGAVVGNEVTFNLKLELNK
jgi:polyisoprenoid-binding protein YceI